MTFSLCINDNLEIIATSKFPMLKATWEPLMEFWGPQRIIEASRHTYHLLRGLGDASDIIYSVWTERVVSLCEHSVSKKVVEDVAWV